MSILKVKDKDGKFVDIPVISGRPASIKVGEVKLLEPNSEPTIENVGTEYDAIFNFGIPRGLPGIQGPKGDTGETGATGPTGPQGPAGTPGADGKASTVKVGTVTTLEAGSNATVTNVGTETNAILNFGIPQGIPGEGGGSGEGGTTNYLLLENKPKINNVELTGNKTLDDLGIQAKGNYLTSVPSVYKTKAENDALYQPKGDYASSSDIPTKVSSFTNDAGYLTSIPSEYITETELNDAISGLGSGTGNVSSDTINSIVVVDALPETEVEGVLYLVKETVNTPSEDDDVNLFDYENANILNGFISRSSQTASPSDTEKTLYIPIESGSTYKATKTSGSRFVMGSCPEVPTTSTTYTVLVHDYTGTELTITTDPGDNYLSIYYWGLEDTITEEEMRKSIVVTKVETEEETDNLFDYTTAPIINGYVSTSGATISSYETRRTTYLAIEPSTTYKITKTASSVFSVGTCQSEPVIGTKFNVTEKNSTGSEITITSGESDNYLAIFYTDTATCSVDETEILQSIVVEKVS